MSTPLPPAPAAPDSSSRKKILFVLMIALAMSLIQVTSVSVALPALGESMHTTSAQLQWVLSGYSLMIGLVLVPAGRLGDLFGSARLFVLGLGLFTLFSVFCGLATDATVLNLLRLVQGASAGLFSPQVTGLIQRYFSGQARAKAFALFGLVVSASVATGPVLAGLIIDALGNDLGWRTTFGLNLPLGILGVILGLKWLPFAEEAKQIAARGASRIDVDPVGIVLLVLAVLAVMLPFMLHGSPSRWLLLPAAAVLAGVWVWWELHYERAGNAPMVRMSLFRIRTFSFATAITTLMFLGVTSQFIVLAIFLQTGLNEPAITVGLIGLPNAVLSAVASVMSARYTIRYGRQLVLGSLVLMVIGMGLAILVMVNLENGWSFWWIAAAFALTGLGQGTMGSAAQTQSMLEVPRNEGGTAGGVLQTAQRIATAIGNTLVTAILLTTLAGTAAPTLGTWVAAVSWSYVAIIALLLAALAVAVAFVLDARKHPVTHAS